MRNFFLMFGLVVVGCGGGIDPNPTLNGLPVEVGEVNLGEVDPWQATDDWLEVRAFVQEPFMGDLRVELGGATRELVPSLTPAPKGARVLRFSWPRRATGAQQAKARLLLDGEVVGTWVVRRDVIDAGVTVCALPGGAEGLTERRCVRPSPFAQPPQLPQVPALGALTRRLEVSVERGAVSLFLPVERREVQVAAGFPLTFEVPSNVPVRLGLKELRPAFEDLGVDLQVTQWLELRAGTTARWAMTFTSRRNGVRIVAVDTVAGQALLTALPLELHEGAEERLEFEATAASFTDTLRLHVEHDGLLQVFDLTFYRSMYDDTRCRLAFEPFTMPKLQATLPVTVHLPVTNTSDDPCTNARVKTAPNELRAFVASFVAPGPGRTSTVAVHLVPGLDSGSLKLIIDQGNGHDLVEQTVPIMVR
jgi:hypothetical protein